MITLKIDRPVNVNLLTEELFAAFPSWRVVGPRGWMTEVEVTSHSITFPDDTDPEQVKLLIQRHDPTAKSHNQRVQADLLEGGIRVATVGDWTEEQALAAIDNGQSVAVLKGLVKAVFGLVKVCIRIAKYVVSHE